MQRDKAALDYAGKPQLLAAYELVASLTGRASVALHTRLVDLCEAGDTAAAAEVSHETWQSLGPLLSTLDAD